MKRWIALVLAAALALPGAVSLFPETARVDEPIYIIPDSDKRLMTREEAWEYSFETLLYAFNEIYARHGYKFETGSKCYNWFTQMSWYTPNETAANNQEVYAQCSDIENQNAELIKSVRTEMRNMNTTNPNGKGMPSSPEEKEDQPRGFRRVDLTAGQLYNVFTAPGTSSYRANKGKAKVSTNGPVYALGLDQGWMLMLYEANFAGQYRVGYIDYSKIRGTRPELDTLSWDGSVVEVLTATEMTDDPALTGIALTKLSAGTKVTYLTTMYNNTGWDYIETKIKGKRARGFVPSGTLSMTGEDITEKEVYRLEIDGDG